MAHRRSKASGAAEGSGWVNLIAHAASVSWRCAQEQCRVRGRRAVAVVITEEGAVGAPAAAGALGRGQKQ